MEYFVEQGCVLYAQTKFLNSNFSDLNLKICMLRPGHWWKVPSSILGIVAMTIVAKVVNGKGG